VDSQTEEARLLEGEPEEAAASSNRNTPPVNPADEDALLGTPRDGGEAIGMELGD
jgi:hypothetical protein